jgi:hypothetical protein
MDTDKTDNPIKEVLDGLFTLLESMETQNAAVLEFLKDQGLAADEKLAPYLNRAASASSVKWRAARARMAYLLAPAPKKATDQKEAPDAKEPKGKAADQIDTQSKNAGTSDGERNDAESKSTEPKVSAERAPEPKTKELDAKPEPKKAEPKNAAPKETKQDGESERSEEPASNSTDASAKSAEAVSQNNSPDSKHVDDSKQDAKSTAAQSGNPGILGPICQIAKPHRAPSQANYSVLT